MTPRPHLTPVRQPHRRRLLRSILAALVLSSTLTAVITAATSGPAAADATPLNLAAGATVSLGSVDNEANRAAYTAYINDGRTDTRFTALTGGGGAFGRNHIDLDLGSSQTASMIRVFTGSMAARQTSQAWVFVSDAPITSSDPNTLRGQGLRNWQLPANIPQRSTVVTGGSFRYVRVISSQPGTQLAISEIEVLGDLGPHLRTPSSPPDTNVNLSLSGIATQWPGTTSEPRRDPAFAIDGNNNTWAQTNTSGSDGAFIQVDLRTTVDVGTIVLSNPMANGCWNGSRVVTTDDGGLVGQTVGDTNRSRDLSGLYSEFATAGAITVNRPVRFVRFQRTSCGDIGIRELIVRPSSRAVMVDPIGDQQVALGQGRSIDVVLRADTPAAVMVKGLPRGFTYDGARITGTGTVAGRWPVEVTALAPDGRTSTHRFVFTVTGAPPTGAIKEPPAVDITGLSNRPTPMDSGVMGNTRGLRISGGNVNDTTPSLDVTVWDLVELDGFMYAGGEFSTVVNSNGTSAPQAFLARFDLTTGAWDDSWRPQLDGNVHALEVSPTGRLLVGGEFRSIDGVPGTSGLAAINVRTGKVDTAFGAFVERPWNPTTPAVVRDIRVAGRWLYVVGKFSHINGAGGKRERAFSAARVTANFGTIDSSWKPKVTGPSIWAVSPNHDRNRVYLSGFFSAIDGRPNTAYGGAVDAVTGDFVPNNYFPKNSRFQRDGYGVESFGDTVWVAGSEHSLSTFRVDGSPLPNPGVTDLLQAPRPLTYSFASNATTAWDWAGGQPLPGGGGGGGDFQFAEKIGDFLLAGCHCQAGIDANGQGMHYNSITNRRTDHRVAIAYHANGPRAFTPVENFKPDIEGGLDGAWTATTDSKGCLWFGGDIIDGGLRTGGRVFTRGFARFCPPAANGVAGLRAAVQEFNRITIAWDGPAGPGNVGSYLIHRNGQQVGEVPASGPLTWTDTSIQAFQRYTYTVYPLSVQGIRGSGTAVSALAGAPDTQLPTTPAGVAAARQGADVSLTWSAASDNTAVKGYFIFRDGAYLGYSTSLSYVDRGAFDLGGGYHVRSEDVAGNRSARSATVYVPEKDPALDTVPPTVPASLTASGVAGNATIQWAPATDNLGVTGYLVFRNGAYIGFSTTTLFTDRSAVYGASYTVRARDAAGNRSDMSSPAVLPDPAGPDTQAPSAPTGLTADLGAGGVTLNWTASSDNVGVTGYLLYRNGGYIGYVAATTFVDAAGVRGDRYDVRAVDAAENRSDKSPDAVAGGPDTTPPSIPADLAGVGNGAGGVTLTWSPSTDDVAMSGYLVYRNNGYLGFTAGTTFTDANAPAGANQYHLRAVDTAQNRSEKSASVVVNV